MPTIKDIFDYVINLRTEIAQLEQELQQKLSINEALVKELEELNRAKSKQ